MEVTNSINTESPTSEKDFCSLSANYSINPYKPPDLLSRGGGRRSIQRMHLHIIGVLCDPQCFIMCIFKALFYKGIQSHPSFSKGSVAPKKKKKNTFQSSLVLALGPRNSHFLALHEILSYRLLRGSQMGLCCLHLSASLWKPSVLPVNLCH